MASGSAALNAMETGLQRLEPILNRIKQVPPRVWRRLCLAVFSLWLVYSLAQMFWIIMPQPAIPEPPLTSPINTVFAELPSGAANVDVESLKQLALFGDGSSAAEVAPVQRPSGIEQEAVDTRLNLTLVGTLASNDDKLSKAFIEEGSKHDSFTPGDELTLGPRGVTLAKVMADRVILDNNGRYETLWLYLGENDFAKRAGPSPIQRPIATERSVPSRPRPDRISNEMDEAQDFVSSVLPADGQEEPTAQQIESVNELINVSMHREGGQLVGFKINPKRDRELFEQLGLKPNDVVTAVNNVGLNDTSQAMEVYRSLSTASQASLEIMRDGATVTVDINLDQQ